jgi:endonuclease-3 related protein
MHGKMIVRREMNRTMPTLDEAFDAVRTVPARQGGTEEPDRSGLAPFERAAGVLLERGPVGTRWRAALESLADENLLSPERLAQADIPEIIDALREAGIVANVRAAAPLKHLARFFLNSGGAGFLAGDDDLASAAGSMATGTLQAELAAIKGIGPATADAILLLALDRPSYPVDRASYRILIRHGWLDSTSTYEEARDLFVERAMNRASEVEDAAARALADLSRTLTQIGRQFCRAAGPRCDGCPLEHLLPEGGPREVDA